MDEVLGMEGHESDVEKGAVPRQELAQDERIDTNEDGQEQGNEVVNKEIDK